MFHVFDRGSNEAKITSFSWKHDLAEVNTVSEITLIDPSNITDIVMARDQRDISDSTLDIAPRDYTVIIEACHIALDLACELYSSLLHGGISI